MKLTTAEDILRVNNEQAEKNRTLFKTNNVYVINIMGSPGAGKTTLLESVLRQLPDDIHAAVIEGDLATAKDAARIADLGVQVVQINTDGGCHLDAVMIAKVLPLFDLSEIDLLLIENVGNLVCPAGFDLGENERLIVLSVAEGGDKPSKYPTTFITADTVVLNKLDLLPYIDIDLNATKQDILTIRPQVKLFEIACRSGAESGIDKLAAYFTAKCGARNK